MRTVRRAVAKLMRHGEERNAADMARFGVRVEAQPAWVPAFSWPGGQQEFEKRAGLALAADLGIHDRSAPDAPFRKFLWAIEGESRDERNFVQNAVPWALGNIGKRKQRVNRAAIAAAERIRREGMRSGQSIAADALPELQSEEVRKRLRKKAGQDNAQR